MPLRWFANRPPAIDDPLWQRVLEAFPFAGHLSIDELDRLRALCEQFLRRKTISGAHDFEVTPSVRAAIAFQACLPVLHLGLAGYDDFVEIVVHPAQFLVPRRHTDEAGVVHESVEALAGEAMDGGPVVLSWEDVAPGAQAYGVNVTIHEFVHKLDLADGEADGVPPLPSSRRRRWRETLETAFDAFCDELDRIERSIPRHVDPESAQADRWYASLPLDPYAATDEAEFFAVCGETFFVAPDALASAFPQWYRELADFFRQDPVLAPSGD